VDAVQSLEDRWRRFVSQVIQASPDLHDTSRSVISSLHAVREEGRLLILSPPNELMVRVVETNYLPMITEHLGRLWDRPVNEIRLEFDPAVVTRQEANGSPDHDLPLFADQPAPTQAKPAAKKKAPAREYGSPLNEAMSFAAFLADSSNDEAFFAAKGFAAKGGTRFNPLYIYGHSGTGKTHLLSAIGNAVKARNPDTPVLYFNGDEFVTLVIDHIRQQRMQLFRRGTQLEGAIVLVDDVQLLSGKNHSLGELFNLFNWHQARGARLAFTSDLPPDQIKGLPERLRSRMGGGLVVEVQPPLFETRVAIGQSTADAISHGLHPLPRSVAEMLAELYCDNTRDLVGAVKRLVLRADFRSAPEITLELAQEMFGDVQARRLHRSPDQIARAIAQLLDVEFSAVRGKGRTRRLVQARIWIAGLVRELTPASQTEIGHLLGRDHSTIHHTLGRYQDLLKSKEGTAQRDALKRRLQKEMG
jgi:chromosomal replication initiator protein